MMAIVHLPHSHRLRRTFIPECSKGGAYDSHYSSKNLMIPVQIRAPFLKINVR